MRLPRRRSDEVRGGEGGGAEKCRFVVAVCSPASGTSGMYLSLSLALRILPYVLRTPYSVMYRHHGQRHIDTHARRFTRLAGTIMLF